MQKDEISQYIDLIQEFVSGRISHKIYSKRYWSLFQNDPRMFPQDIYELLNNLFTDIDVCEEEESLREDYGISREQLLENACATLDTLRRI
jgi:hypothetical protein